MIWSYSALNHIETCAFKFAHIRIYKNYEDSFTAKSATGNDVHNYCNEALKYNERELPSHAKEFQSFLDRTYVHIDKVSTTGKKYKIMTEETMGLTKSGKACGYFDKEPKNVFRGKIDFGLVTGNVALLIDYKTGNPRYAKSDQLDTQAVLLKSKHPELKKIHAYYMWTDPSSDTGRYVYTENDLERLRLRINKRIDAAEALIAGNDFEYTPCFMCGNCPVEVCTEYTGA